MKLLLTWAFLMFTATTVFAQANATTFHNAEVDELYHRQTTPELYCLAQNIYFEAKSEPLAGQYAVADVVLNRVKDTRYPNTICEVVKEGPTKESWKTKQFPDLQKVNGYTIQFDTSASSVGTATEKPDNVVDGDAWRQAQIIAYKMVYADRYRGITEGATHYHADYVSPKWASTIQLVGSISTHIFYRWP